MKSICVYCGSNVGGSDVYAEAARSLAKALVSRDLTLVYGGASVGMMGVVANAVLEYGGRAVGVIPHSLARHEVAHSSLTELHLTSSMHERKLKMFDCADGFIAMPGGLGTMEEIFEVCTWSQLGLNDKPCGLLNVAGYYDALTTFLDHAVREQFLRPEHRAMLMVDDDANTLLDRFAEFTPPNVQKWVDP